MKNKILYLSALFIGLTLITGLLYAQIVQAAQPQIHTGYANTITVSACPYSYEYESATLTLIDSNGELWAFVEISEPPKDSEIYTITYIGHYELLQLKNAQGHEILYK